MFLKVFMYYIAVVILLVVAFAGGAVILFYMQGTNILSDPKDRAFAEFYLFCIPFIAALIAIPNGIERFKKKK